MKYESEKSKNVRGDARPGIPKSGVYGWSDGFWKELYVVSILISRVILLNLVCVDRVSTGSLVAYIKFYQNGHVSVVSQNPVRVLCIAHE